MGSILAPESTSIVTTSLPAGPVSSTSTENEPIIRHPNSDCRHNNKFQLDNLQRFRRHCRHGPYRGPPNSVASQLINQLLARQRWD